MTRPLARGMISDQDSIGAWPVQHHRKLLRTWSHQNDNAYVSSHLTPKCDSVLAVQSAIESITTETDVEMLNAALSVSCFVFYLSSYIPTSRILAPKRETSQARGSTGGYCKHCQLPRIEGGTLYNRQVFLYLVLGSDCLPCGSHQGNV